MTGAIAALRVAALTGGFDRSPAYAGLAESLRLLIGDGRVDSDLRLPSERDLSVALGVSRTTVTRAYAALVESGFAEARQGSGTYTRVPGGRLRARDRGLMSYVGDDADDMVDLGCAAPPAPPGLAAAYAEAVDDLPVYLAGQGYFPTGLPALQAAVAASYDTRGLPTDPSQVLVLPGALAATSVVAQTLLRPRDRVLVESPGYPNAMAAVRRAGARLVPAPMDAGGWDLDTVDRLLQQTRPALAYVVPDFQNPTGHLMPSAQREELAALLQSAGTVALVDETHQPLTLSSRPTPRPFATWSPGAISVGSTSKSFWGGLRVGWVRCPDGSPDLLERLRDARVSLDLGVPVLEQLLAARLLDRREDWWADHRVRLRGQRDALAAALRASLPDWRFRLPRGGLCLWCELPLPASSVALAAEAERLGVIVSPGPVFAAGGGLGSWVRVPFTRPPDELRDAVARLTAAWQVVVGAGRAHPAPRRTPVMVA